MKKKNIITGKPKKELHALAQKVYYYKKKGDAKGLEKAKKQQAALQKEAAKTQAQRDTEHKRRLNQRVYAAKVELKKNELKATATKKDLKKLFRKVVDANTERSNFSRPKNAKTGKKGRRKKGVIEEQFSVWETKQHAADIMEGKVEHALYRGEDWAFSFPDYYTELNDAAMEMESKDSCVVSVDIASDNVLNVRVIKNKIDEESEEN